MVVQVIGITEQQKSSVNTYNYQCCSQPAKHTIAVCQPQRHFLFPPFTRAHASSCHLLIVNGQAFKTHVVMQPIIGDVRPHTIVPQYNIFYPYLSTSGSYYFFAIQLAWTLAIHQTIVAKLQRYCTGRDHVIMRSS